MDNLKKNLKFLLKDFKEKQTAIASYVGKSKQLVSGWANGVSEPSVRDLSILSEYFGLTMEDLLKADLSNVHLTDKSKSREKGQNVHPNVHGNVHPKAVYGPDKTTASLVNEPETTTKTKGKLARMPLVITVDTSGRENVVMVPVKARAGYLSGAGDKEFIGKLPTYSLPGLNNGTFRMFEVEGLSMYPTLHGGDIVVCSNVEQWQDIRDDRLHVIVTKNEGIVVKRVLNRLAKDGKLILKSDNYKDRELYPTIVCELSDIMEVWYCTGFLSRQMRPPAETYNRLIDLEARFTLIEAELKHRPKK